MRRDMLEAVRLAKFAGQGSWPAAGGTLDQAQWFIEAAELANGLADRFRADAMEAASRGN